VLLTISKYAFQPIWALSMSAMAGHKFVLSINLINTQGLNNQESNLRLRKASAPSTRMICTNTDGIGFTVFIVCTAFLSYFGLEGVIF
jgi:hypothetical protein